MNYIKTFFISLCFIFISACSHQQSANEIKVGTISGPETQLMAAAKDVALKKYGLIVDIVEFSDYNMPNTALSDGSIDANMFQHQPYLDEVIKNKHYDLVAVGKTFIYPMGIYSSKLSSINDVKTKDIIAIPDDPSNEARALLLLQKAGLITLKAGSGATASPLDIVNNPKQLQVKELDAAQLPRVLPDVALAVINTNYAIPAGLMPTPPKGVKPSLKNALFVEGKDSLYANLVVVKTADQNRPQFKELVDALHSPEVLQSAQQLFNGQAIQAW